MNHQNWKKTVISSKHKTHTKNLKNKVLTNNNIQGIKKTRKTSGTVEGKKLYKLLESDNMEIPVSSHEFKSALMKARGQSGMKQKEFAQRLGVKESMLKSIENGKVVPENNLIAKMEKILKCKLPRIKKVKY